MATSSFNKNFAITKKQSSRFVTLFDTQKKKPNKEERFNSKFKNTNDVPLLKKALSNK